MKLKKICFILLLIVAIMICNINMPVKAGKISDWWEDLTFGWETIKTEYNNNYIKDSDFYKKMDKEERDKRIKVIDKMLKNYTTDPSQTAGGTIPYYPETDIKIAKKISRLLQDANKQDNVDSNKTNGTGETDQDLKDYDVEQIMRWLDNNDVKYLSEDVKLNWKGKINKIENETSRKHYLLLLDGKTSQEAYEETTGEDLDTTTSRPITGTIGQSNASSSHTPDEVIDEANDFISAGQNEGTKINGEALKEASNTLYNILLVIGIFLAVAIGMYLGIKFMLSSAEDRAKVKESLVPYIAGCVVIFGAFIIWKLAITLLGNLA